MAKQKFLNFTVSQLILAIILNLTVVATMAVIMKQLYCPVTLEEYNEMVRSQINVTNPKK